LTGYWAPKEIPGEVKLSADGKTTEFQIGTPKELAQQFAKAGIKPEDFAKRLGGATSAPEYNPEAAEKVKKMHLTETDLDPTFSCLPPGVPRIGAPTEIAQIPNAIILLYDAYPGGSITRVIPTDGRPHDPKLDSSYNGDSVGHWEGDTLVVDVTNFNDRTWFDRAGNFHSDALHLVERFTSMSPDIIQYDVTIEDPKVFTRPWHIAMPLYRRVEPNMQLLEFRCNEFAEEFMYGNLRKQPLVTHWEGDTMTIDITRKIPPGDSFYDWYR
jgi:hypothetical protein